MHTLHSLVIWWRTIALAGVVIGILLMPAACTVTIVPPLDVREPVTIFLLDHGRTSSLVVPDEFGGMVRWGYGDWNWYALDRTGALQVFPTLFWPTQGALGRWSMSGPLRIENIRRQLDVEIEHAYVIQVEQQAAVRLREELDRIYQRNLNTLVVNEAAGFAFVHHPKPYTLFHNSNHVVADWLREMGVRTKGLAGDSRWRVAEDR